MRTAPAARFELPSRDAPRAVGSLLCAAAAAAAVAWFCQRNLIAAQVPAALSAVASGVLCLLAWQRKSSLLRWDGECWHYAADAAAERDERAGELIVALDLGRCLLLRFRPSAKRAERVETHWIYAERGDAPAHWHALRCAVYSPRPNDEASSKEAAS